MYNIQYRIQMQCCLRKGRLIRPGPQRKGVHEEELRVAGRGGSIRGRG
jgi:hypothetical protein